jgi:hypothetical protein
MAEQDGIARLPRRVPIAEVQGTLALELQPRQEPPATPPVSGRDHGTTADVVPIDRAQRRELDAWVGRFGQAAVEIAGGDRPASQLVRWTSADVYASLERRALLVGRAGHHQPGQGRVQPVRPKVMSVHSAFVTPGVVETSIHVRYGERSRALAARFEARHGRWVCTALEWA